MENCELARESVVHPGVSALRYSAGPFGDLVSEPLLAERFGVLCSPSLAIDSPDDLQRVALLHPQWKSRTEAPDWTRWARLARMTDLPISLGARFTDDGHALQAAIAGHGAIVSSLFLAAPDIDAGLLCHPFEPVIEGETYHILATRAALARSEVVAVRDWLRAIVAS